MKNVIIVFFGILISLQIAAQDLTIQLNQFLDTELEKFNLPNLEVLVVSKDALLFSKSISDVDRNSKYYIGSVSKSLTAFGVLKLVEVGKLSLETKVIEILPEIEFQNSSDEITIWNLLTHTSGITKESGFLNLPSLQELNLKKCKIPNNQLEPLRHEYSNLNYAILGLVIQKVSNLSFQAFMQNEVFKPLEMNNTIVGAREEVAPQLIEHYQHLGPFVLQSRQLEYHESSIPAGFICSSVNDLGKYLQMNLSNGKLNDRVLLDSSLLQTMHAVWNNTDFGYAMGWKKGSYNNQPFLQHLGSTANSYSGIFIIPEKEIGFVLLSNSNSLNFTEEVAEGILNVLTGGEQKKVSRYEFILRLGVFGGYFFVLFYFMYKIKKALSADFLDRKKTFRNMIGRILLVSLFLFSFPKIAQIPFVTFVKIQPDIGWLIMFSIFFSLLLS